MSLHILAFARMVQERKILHDNDDVWRNWTNLLSIGRKVPQTDTIIYKTQIKLVQ